jgi:thiol-disulfide isomerase/thioredoxin
MSDPSPSSPKQVRFERRVVLTAGLAAAATLAGVGTAVWQNKNAKDLPAETQVKPIAGDLNELWQMQFDTPDGGKLAMQALKGKPLLINFWATWCPPCVEELPLLERFYLQNKAKSMQIVGLAADKPDAVRSFLKKLPLTFPVGVIDLSGIALSKSWGNLAGGLPFTVILAADGRVMQRKMGKLCEEDLKTWLDATH